MSVWLPTTLGELCDRGGGEIRTGPFGSQLHEADYSGLLTDIPVIMPKDIATGRVDDEGIARVSIEHVERLAQHKLEVGDIVYGRRGDIGRKALIGDRERGWLCGTGCLRVTVGGGTDPRFLFYRLGHPETVEAIRNRAIGATMPNLNTTILREVELTVPDLATQQRISSILGAYDDLIEVNRRRVAILEEMARGLFEEWFVRLRFPGSEGPGFDEVSDGALPRGWVLAMIGDVAGFVSRGIAPKYCDDVGTLVVGQKCIRDQKLSLALARRQSKPVPADKIVQPGDVLINSTGVGTLGRVAQAEEVPPGLTVDSHVTIVRPASQVDRDYLGACLMRMQPVFEALGAGSTGQTELARTAVQGLEIMWPPESLRARYGAAVRPMRELIAGLSTQAIKLASSRDLLLPRLISGQLSVEAAERQLENAA
ncbi:MAG: restriction endonuclease subunit S [Sphingomonadaceae bacterium]|nr:restriction endonuclease subunit S [Sphingomonadaceae bacterium]